ncbi:MAG: NUDIX domain-containing protein [Bacilli bacterium]|nr:NUDIX domain-containing protein [Bacilli bacterium]
MKKEKSCGVLVFDDNKILMVHHNLGHWGFPKGHVEEGETEEETAIREVKEETNCDVEIIPGYRDMITYSPKEGVMKDVVYFIGKPITKNLINQEIEVSEVLFVPIKEAVLLVTYEDEKGLLDRAIKYWEGSIKNDRN